MAIKQDKYLSSFAPGKDFVLDEATEVFIPASDRPRFEYADGGSTEQKVHSIIKEASDVRDGSADLSRAIYDFPSRYHLSPERANLVRPVSNFLSGRVLEIGAGCGAVTRFLGETASQLWALEGSLRRAAIARARCRGLGNVSVLSTNVEDFCPETRFSAVTLIGVLEYARMYIKGGPAAMLRHCLRLLEDGGVLIIAIENQLGLKYFAGSPEDHLGVPFLGIEGRYERNTQVTFGRAELTKLLNEAGFASHKFLYPFPDYKFPRVVVPESAMDAHDANVETLLRTNAVEHGTLGLSPFFSEEMVWPQLLRNGLAHDMANSFLVLASSSQDRFEEFDPPVWMYNVNTRRCFAKAAHFRPGGEKVVRERLYPDEPNPESSRFERHLSSEPLYHGPLLGDRYVDVLNKPGWTEEDLARISSPWAEYLKGRQLADTEGLLPGCLVDCTPFNIACLPDGSLGLFDQEWVAKESIPLTFVLFRGLLNVLSRMGSVATPGLTTSERMIELIPAVMELLGFPQTETNIRALVELEAQLYDFVFGSGDSIRSGFATQALRFVRAEDVRIRLRAEQGRSEAALGQLQQDHGALEHQHRVLEHEHGALLHLHQALEHEHQKIEHEYRTLTQQIQALEQEDEQLQHGRLYLEQERLQMELQHSQLEHDYRQLEHDCRELERQRQALQLKKDEIAALAQQREREVSESQSEIAQLKSEIASGNAQSAQLEHQIAEAIAAHERVSTGLTQQKAEMQKLVSSRSWRFTAPIRSISNRGPLNVDSMLLPFKMLAWAMTFRLPSRLRMHRDKLLLTRAGLFDEAYYFEQNPDVAAAKVDALAHYLSHGGFEGRNPHPLFDSAWYLQRNEDVASAGVNPLVHYVRNGGFEGRDPHPLFGNDWYLRQNPDVAAADVNPLSHYLQRGALEGRNPHPDFDGAWYLAQNPDVALNGMNPLVHYVQFGQSEGRPTAACNRSVDSNQSVVLTAVPVTAPSAAVAKDYFTSRRTRVVFVSGEAHTPGHQYRIDNMATCLPPRLFDVTIIRNSEAPESIDLVKGADVVWIWRAAWTDQLGALIQEARRENAKIIFDVDDLMFRPELVSVEMIDGIRSQGLTEAGTQQFYERVRNVLWQADHCTTPTIPLAHEARDMVRATSIIPNGFDRKFWNVSRSAFRERANRKKDGLIRIGYASGSFTHQRDLAVASRAIASVLRENPSVRLVLFRRTVQVEEFEELRDLQAQIEWRDLVPLQNLAFEYARFDINLAPVEVGNRFCEAKSELKFFEAALVGVPTIASPTRPFADAIRHGETGFLANSEHEWRNSLEQLIRDPRLRDRMAARAYLDSLWVYGPERRGILLSRLLNQLLAPSSIRADLFLQELESDAAQSLPAIEIPEYDVLYQSPRTGSSRVTVVMPLFNYAQFVEEALESVLQQTVRAIDVIVVDDMSTDNSAAVARVWLEQHASNFNMVALLQNRCNSKLGRTRNTAVSFCDTEFFLPLDADNILLPDFIEKCIGILDETGAAYAYPTLEKFGDEEGRIGVWEYNPGLFRCGNYIDAMAMVRKACWIAVGGYSALDPMGWEDYEFWCKFVRKGFFGVRVPEVIGKYRVHGNSMLQTITEIPENKPRVLLDFESRHPWLQLRQPKPAPKAERPGEPSPDGSSARTSIPVPQGGDRQERLLSILRCPETGERLLRLNEHSLTNESGSRQWPIVEGRPVFTPEGSAVKVHPVSHLSNELSEEAIQMCEQTSGLVLNLSAGGTAVHYPNVVELEYSIFRHTDVVGDVHSFPFQDEVFEAVVCMNAFEHYREPDLAMEEIRRVLKPGGRLYLRTAFLQPLHEAPHHYYNCTEFGLRQWMRNFNVDSVEVSDNFNPVYALSWISSELENSFRQSVSAEAAAAFANARLGDIAGFWRDPKSRTSPLWHMFYSLPPSQQRKVAAGWEALASK